MTHSGHTPGSLIAFHHRTVLWVSSESQQVSHFSLIRNLTTLRCARAEGTAFPLILITTDRKQVDTQWYVITVIGITSLITGKVILFYPGMYAIEKDIPVYIWTVPVKKTWSVWCDYGRAEFPEFLLDSRRSSAAPTRFIYFSYNWVWKSWVASSPDSF